jgi:hypothetical protein
MKAWSIIGLLFAAAIFATIPISPQVTPRGLELSVDGAKAVTYAHYRRVHRRVYRRHYRYARRAYRRAYYYGAPSYYYGAPSYYYGRRYRYYRGGPASFASSSTVRGSPTRRFRRRARGGIKLSACSRPRGCHPRGPAVSAKSRANAVSRHHDYV